MDLQIIQNKIFEIRGYRVMLDFHLAELYGVQTKALKQAVKRKTLPARLPFYHDERGMGRTGHKL